MEGTGRGRGRGRGGTPLAGIAEIDAELGTGASQMPKSGPPTKGRGRGGKEGGDFRGKPGLFKKGDWNCPQCNNINWERRTKCNICQFDKPGHLTVQEEQRTGLGGGFNERQSRASGLSVEVDEEGYDDFGRRKKKAATDRKAKEAAALARLQASFGMGGSSVAESNGTSCDSKSTKKEKVRSRSRSRSRKKKDSKSKKHRSRSRSRSRRRSRSRKRH
mmetsp:Transcript_35394/g.45453  ORF Transcript_35394/g.45453 Transcript_35394/m.45453 type:complete len:218 (-) Transcript_35394:51-704(-)